MSIYSKRSYVARRKQDCMTTNLLIMFNMSRKMKSSMLNPDATAMMRPMRRLQ